MGILGKAWGWLRDRLDPTRIHAERLIQAFEAYGIARQQIPRLMPAGLTMPNAAFSSPDKLKAHLTPALLNWAAEHLAIRRSWLDGVGAQPHLIEDHYKAVAGYRDWLTQRIEHPTLQRGSLEVRCPALPYGAPMMEQSLDSVEKGAINDRLVSALVGLALMGDESKVGLVLEEMTERAAAERHAGNQGSARRSTRLRSNAVLHQLLLQVME